jgi:hypothetical protein
VKSLQVIPSRFDPVATNLASSTGLGSGNLGTNHVRRMTRGIVLKEETFATLRVVTGGNKSVKIVDAGGRRADPDDPNKYMSIGNKRATDVYSNFLLQQVQEERMEKQQIVESFGEPYIFLFGERARVMSFSGILANTFDFNWEAEWWHNYEHFLRGTRCVESDARVFLSFDTTLVGGYIVAASASKSTTDQNWVQFQFQLFVTSYANFSDIGNPNAAPFEDGFRRQDSDLSEAEASVYRPALLDSGSIQLADGDTNAFAIDEFGQSLVDTLSSVWTRATQVADGVISGISQMLNGDTIRVPLGFAGALAFDDDSEVALNLRDVKFGGKIKYTTFDQNEDEYVGRGTHYGSSAIGQVDFGVNRDEDVFGTQEQLDKVKEAWENVGIVVPSAELGIVTSTLARGIVGMTAVGATRSWSAFASTDPSGLSDFGVLTNLNPLGTAIPE